MLRAVIKRTTKDFKNGSSIKDESETSEYNYELIYTDTESEEYEKYETHPKLSRKDKKHKSKHRAKLKDRRRKSASRKLRKKKHKIVDGNKTADKTCRRKEKKRNNISNAEENYETRDSTEFNKLQHEATNDVNEIPLSDSQYFQNETSNQKTQKSKSREKRNAKEYASSERAEESRVPRIEYYEKKLYETRSTSSKENKDSSQEIGDPDYSMKTARRLVEKSKDFTSKKTKKQKLKESSSAAERREDNLKSCASTNVRTIENSEITQTTESDNLKSSITGTAEMLENNCKSRKVKKVKKLKTRKAREKSNARDCSESDKVNPHSYQLKTRKAREKSNARDCSESDKVNPHSYQLKTRKAREKSNARDCSESDKVNPHSYQLKTRKAREKSNARDCSESDKVNPHSYQLKTRKAREKSNARDFSESDKVKPHSYQLRSRKPNNSDKNSESVEETENSIKAKDKKKLTSFEDAELGECSKQSPIGIEEFLQLTEEITNKMRKLKEVEKYPETRNVHSIVTTENQGKSKLMKHFKKKCIEALGDNNCESFKESDAIQRGCIKSIESSNTETMKQTEFKNVISNSDSRQENQLFQPNISSSIHISKVTENSVIESAEVSMPQRNGGISIPENSITFLNGNLNDIVKDMNILNINNNCTPIEQYFNRHQLISSSYNYSTPDMVKEPIHFDQLFRRNAQVGLLLKNNPLSTEQNKGRREFSGNGDYYHSTQHVAPEPINVDQPCQTNAEGGLPFNKNHLSTVQSIGQDHRSESNVIEHLKVVTAINYEQNNNRNTEENIDFDGFTFTAPNDDSRNNISICSNNSSSSLTGPSTNFEINKNNNTFGFSDQNVENQQESITFNCSNNSSSSLTGPSTNFEINKNNNTFGFSDQNVENQQESITFNCFNNSSSSLTGPSPNFEINKNNNTIGLSDQYDENQQESITFNCSNNSRSSLTEPSPNFEINKNNNTIGFSDQNVESQQESKTFNCSNNSRSSLTEPSFVFADQNDESQQESITSNCSNNIILGFTETEEATDYSKDFIFEEEKDTSQQEGNITLYSKDSSNQISINFNALRGLIRNSNVVEAINVDDSDTLVEENEENQEESTALDYLQITRQEVIGLDTGFNSIENKYINEEENTNNHYQQRKRHKNTTMRNDDYSPNKKRKVTQKESITQESNGNEIDITKMKAENNGSSYFQKTKNNIFQRSITDSQHSKNKTEILKHAGEDEVNNILKESNTKIDIVRLSMLDAEIIQNDDSPVIEYVGEDSDVSPVIENVGEDSDDSPVIEYVGEDSGVSPDLVYVGERPGIIQKAPKLQENNNKVENIPVTHDLDNVTTKEKHFQMVDRNIIQKAPGKPQDENRTTILNTSCELTEINLISDDDSVPEVPEEKVIKKTIKKKFKKSKKKEIRKSKNIPVFSSEITEELIDDPGNKQIKKPNFNVVFRDKSLKQSKPKRTINRNRKFKQTNFDAKVEPQTIHFEVIPKRQHPLIDNRRNRTILNIGTTAKELKLQCECEQEFDSASELLQHAKLQHYECDVCSKQFTDVDLLKEHAAQYDSKFVCNVCRKVYNNRTSLYIHQRKHFPGKAYECDICDKTFTRVDNLTRHVKAHSQKKMEKCDRCGQTFAQLASLRRHLKEHDRVTLHKCPYCDYNKTFTQKSNLIRHIKNMHDSGYTMDK